MNSTQSPRKEWEPTPEAFAKLLAKLASDPEIGGRKYEELRRQLIKFFEWRGSFLPDELADETLNRLARKIDEGEGIEKNVLALALGIARYVFLESSRHPENRRTELEELVSLASITEPHDEDDDLWLVCLRECLLGIPKGSRELIIEYYQEEKRTKIDARKTLADRHGISLNALFSRAERIRDKLEQCVTRCVKRKTTETT